MPTKKTIKEKINDKIRQNLGEPMSSNNKKSAGAMVLALPTAGYGAAEAIGTSLPAISGYGAAMATPVALTLMGPAYGAYEWLTGKEHYGPRVLPQEREQMVYTPISTAIDRKHVIQSPSYTDNLQVVTGNSTDNEGVPQTQSRTSIGSRLSSMFNFNNDDDDDNDIDFKQVKEWFKNKFSSKQPVIPNESSWRRNIGKFLWETKGNNYGNLYKWRNLGRTLLSPVTVPAALKGAGYSLGYTLDKIPQVMEDVGESFEKGRQKAISTQDTTRMLKQSQTYEMDPDEVEEIQRLYQDAASPIGPDSARVMIDNFFNNVGK